MADTSAFKGYQEDFLGKDFNVSLPKLSDEDKDFVAPVKNQPDNILHYHNFSLVQHAVRKFPFFTAANIDGKRFVSLKRSDVFESGRDRWLKDRRIQLNHQWGNELYKAAKSDFDKGHMTKREDVQWGKNAKTARRGAQSTFYYTNAVPQREELNREVWRMLENYILHDETVGHDLKINLLTGPVLRDEDPIFVTTVREEKIRIPSLFWKVIYFVKPGGDLHRVAFLVGQENLLLKHNIVEAPERSRGFQDPFSDFKLGDTYQVKSAYIEKITGLKLPEAKDPFVDPRPSKLLMEQVNLRSLSGPKTVINGLQL